MPTTFSVRYFSSMIQRFPGNAVFFPDGILFDVTGDAVGEFSSVDRAAALAELGVRFYLSRDNRFKAVLEAAFGSDSLRDFLGRCTLVSCGNDSLDGLRKTLGGHPGDVVADAVCSRFSSVLSADGVIPVFNPADGEAWLLPFSFTGKVSPGAAPVILDAAGDRIRAWSDEMENLPEPVGMDVRMEMALPRSLADIPVGSSLLLPVLAAWWRHEGRIPRYDPFRFVFTGSFKAGTLRRVEAEAKERKVSAIKDGILFAPSGASIRPTRTSLPEGSSVKTVFEAVRSLAEEETSSSLPYAKKRIVDFERDVRQGRYGGWPSVLRRLENVCVGLNPDFAPSAWLAGLLLRAAANCHAGDTAEAARLNAEALAFCNGKARFEEGLLRALVDQLVILQDFEDFDALLALAPDLDAKIAAYALRQGDVESVRDLQMRFHGSMGQFHAYASLAGVCAGVCTPQSAREHLDTAFEKAQLLCENAGTDDKLAVRSNDVAQDANYLLLWHSLFDRSGLPDAFERSMNCVGSLLAIDSAGGRKNRLFAHRDAAMGLYRAVLLGEGVPRLPDAHFEEVLDAHDEGGWIAGTTAKYLGAVAAFNGDEAEAARLFRIAAEAIQPEAKEVIGVIRMTIHAEAFRSLRRFPGLAAKAEEYRREALRFFASGDSAAATKQAWRNWLEAPDATDFPGLSYWY